MTSLTELIAASEKQAEQDKASKETGITAAARGLATGVSPEYRTEQLMQKMALASKLIEFSEKASMERINLQKEKMVVDAMKRFMGEATATKEDATEAGKTKQTKIEQINKMYKEKLDVSQKDVNLTFEERDDSKGKGGGDGHSAMKTAWDVAKQMAIPDERRQAGEEDSKYTAKYDPAYYQPRVETIRKYMPLAEGYILAGSKEPIDAFLKRQEEEKIKKEAPYGTYKGKKVETKR